MNYLYERLQITDKNLMAEVARVISAFKPMVPNYADNLPPILEGNPRKPNDYRVGLEFLAEHKIIEYEKIQMRETELLYRITIINRYNLELLSRELALLLTRPEALEVDRIKIPQLPSMVYYELSTGNIVINGKVNTLTKTNKKLFDAMYIAYPGYADRKELLKIVAAKKKREAPTKVALNEVFSLLRSACGVTAKTISLRSEGGRLNARAFPLSAQLPYSIK